MATEIEATVRTKAPRRRFMLLDGMVLVAATAAGYAVVHAFASEFVQGDLSSVLRESLSTGQFRDLAVILLLCALPVLAAWTLALVPLGLLKPRPRFRRLTRQPGLMAAISFATAAGLLATTYLFFVIVTCLADSGSNLSTIIGLMLSPVGVLFLLPVFFGVAISASWTTLILSRRWQAEPSWIDRMGRALGVFWIVFALASPFLLILM
jgi:hypothetical protein